MEGIELSHWTCRYTRLLSNLGHHHLKLIEQQLHMVKILSDLYEQVPDSGKESTLKLWLLRCVSLLINATYFHDLNASLFACHHQVLSHKSQELETLIHFFMEWIDVTSLSETRTHEQRPLWLDLEVSLSLSKVLKELTPNDSRIIYLMDTLDHGVEKANILSTRDVHFGRKLQCTEEGLPLSTPLVPLVNKPTDIVLDSLISQVKDLFPDLGEGFIQAGLEDSNNDSETFIAKFLEGSLSAKVLALDRSLPGQDTLLTTQSTTEPTVLESRKNIFDLDEFDVFHRGKVDVAKVHRGKKEYVVFLFKSGFLLIFFLRRKKSTNLDTNQKTKILGMSFDEYDDEYDDTYDTDNVQWSNTMDLETLDDVNLEETLSKQQNSKEPASSERQLVTAYQTDATLFDKSNRKSKGRESLKEATGMSDEQIEGWKVMLDRNVCHL